MEIRHTKLSKTISIKNILFLSYYNLIENQFSMTTLYIVLITIEYFQNINLIQFKIKYSTTNEILQINYPLIYFTITKVRCIFLLYPSGNFSLSKGITALFLCLFILQFILIILFRKREITKPKPVYKSFTYSFFLFLQILYMHVLTIPLLITFLSFIQCISNGENETMINYPDIQCDNGNYNVMLVISSISLCLFLIIIILNSFFLFDQNPKSKLPFASVNSGNKIISQALKLNLCIFYIIYPADDYTKAYLTFTICFVKFIFRFFQMSFYNPIISWLSMTHDSGELLFSIIAIIHQHDFHSITLQSVFIEIIISYLFGATMNIVIKKIHSWIFLQPFQSLRTNHSILLKVILLVDYAKDFKANDYKRSLFMSQLHYHRLHCLNFRCKCETYAKVLNKKADESSLKPMNTFEKNIIRNLKKVAIIDGVMLEPHEIENFQTEDESANSSLAPIKKASLFYFTPNAIITESERLRNQYMINTSVIAEDLTEAECIYGFIKLKIEKILAKGLNTNISMIFGYILKNNLSNYFKGLHEMMKLNKKKHTLTENFAIYCYRTHIENVIYSDYKNNINEDLSIETILEYNEITNKIIDSMKDISMEMFQFWSIITLTKFTSTNSRKSKRMISFEGKSTDGPDIYTCAIQASKSIDIIKDFYEKMLSTKQFINKKVLYIYLLFLERVIIQTDDVKKIKEKLRLYENEHNNLFEQLSHQNDELYRLFRTMDRVGIILISGDIQHIGKILSVNHQFCSIFKYSKEELNKDTVNKLIPSYIAQYHDEFICRYLDTSKRHILDELRILFGITKEGLLLPTYIYSKLIPNLNQSVRFIGIMKPLRKDHPFLEPDADTFPPNYELIGNKFCFMLVTQKGEIFGVNKYCLKCFGIPLTLLNLSFEKSESGISLQTLFPSANFDDYEIKSKLFSNEGAILKLDSRNVKHLFDDYKESIIGSNAPIKKTVAKIKVHEVFKEHTVLCYSYQLKFNEGQVPIQIFKMTPIQKVTSIDTIIDSITPKNRGRRRMTQIQFSTVISDNEDNNKHKKQLISEDEDILSRRKKFLKVMKIKLTSYSTPKSIKIFTALIMSYIALLFMFSISEYFVFKDLCILLMNFVEGYFNNIERCLYYSLLMLNFKIILLYENNLIQKDGIDIDTMYFLLENDISYTIDLNNRITPYLTYLQNKFGEKINFNIQTQAYHMYENFTFYATNQGSFYIIDSILVKLDALITKDGHKSNNFLLLSNKNDVFYFNKNLPKSTIADSILLDIFYVSENYINVARFEMEKSIFLFHIISLNNGEFINLNKTTFLFIPSFCLVVIAAILFYIVLKKVADYKMNILRIFYLIDKQYGLDAMEQCTNFIQLLEKIVSSTSNYNDYIDKMKDMPFIHPELPNKKKVSPEGKRIGIYGTSPNYTPIGTEENLLSTNRDLLTECDQIEKPSVKDSKLPQGTRSVGFWRIEKDDDIMNGIKNKKNMIIKQLNKSKQIFWRHLGMIYLFIIFLLVASIIYGAVSISINHNFKIEGIDQSLPIYNFGIRGWSYVNLLFFYRELIFRDSKSSNLPFIDYKNSSYLSQVRNLSSFDMYSLYMNQTDSMENFILLLSTQKTSQKSFLDDVKELELNLNSDKYCEILRDYDPHFYENAQAACDEFYKNNLGLKDNIRIVYANLKNNFPEYDSKDIDSLSKSLNVNISFIYNTEIFISQALLMELSTIKKSFSLFGNQYQNTSLTRTLVYTVFLVLEIIASSYIIWYLIKNLNKDKMIFILLPFDSMMLTQKTLDLLRLIENS